VAAFERMEEKVLMQEARAQGAAELCESQFMLESGSGVDDELALKAQMSSPGTSQINHHYFWAKSNQ